MKLNIRNVNLTNNTL